MLLPACEPALRHAAGIFLPATAVDRSGNRIDQGGGYYDTFLAALQDSFPVRPQAYGDVVPVPAAAIVYDFEVLPANSIPSEFFDRKVSAVLTPGGTYGLGHSPEQG